MGNAALCAGKASHSDAVTVLKADGNFLTFESTIRVADLILEFPNHFMCHSSSLLLLQHVKILPAGTTLIPGEVYFLVPIPGREIENNGPAIEEDSDTESLLHYVEPPKRNIRSASGQHEVCDIASTFFENYVKIGSEGRKVEAKEAVVEEFSASTKAALA